MGFQQVELSGLVSELGKYKRVLLIEDEPHWQMVICKYLRTVHPNISVRCARSARQARQLLYESSSYDIIIADFYLGGEGTGLDVWRDCKDAKLNIPFVMITAMEQRKILALLAREESAPACFEKSMDPYEFEHLVTLTLDGVEGIERRNWFKRWAA